MPTPLSVAAPMMPATCVPCHELALISQLEKVEVARSAAETQSPGSLASLSRPSPSFEIAASLTMSWPGSNLPARSGWSKRTPVSSTATTIGAPRLVSQAETASIAETASPSGARRYHWPTAGPPAPLKPPAKRGSFGSARRNIRRSGSAYSTCGSRAMRAASACAVPPWA